MNIEKLIENKFLFLIKYNFAKKIYQKNSETEVYFSNENITICIYYNSLLDNPKKYLYSVSVSLKSSKFENNLLWSDEIFGKDNLKKLETQLVGKKGVDQIEIYSKFIESNFNQLIIAS